MEHHRVEVDVGEVQALFGAVVDPLTGQVAVQVHLAEADRVALVVAAGNRGHRGDVGHVRDGREGPDGRLDGQAEVRRVHGLGDVQRAQVAGDVLAGLVVGQVIVVRGGLGDLEDLRAQVGHDDLAVDRVFPVHGVLEHDVRVAGFELDLGERLEELARLDLGLLDPGIVHHLVVLLGDRDVGERHAVDLFDVVRGEQVHVLVPLGELEGDVRDDDAEREGLDADLLVRVLALGVQEAVDVRVVRVQVHRTGTLAGTELVGVGEAVLEELHHGDDTGGLILDLLDRRADLADVGQREGHAAAALGQLQRGVDGPADRLHVVFDAEQEAGDQFAALALAGVQERRGGRLEAALDDLVHHLGGELLVAAGQVQGHHADAVLVALQEALSVERLQRVGGVELERAEEGLKAELLLVRAVVELADEVHRVLVEGFALVVLVLDEVVELFLEVVEEHGVVVHVLQEVLVRGLAVGLELDLPVGAVEVQHGVQLVVAQALVRGRHLVLLLNSGGGGTGARVQACAFSYCCVCDSRVQNSSNPCCTRLTSSGVPMSSKRYRCGTLHLAAMMSPAMQ